jgi:hypothetical protein
MHIYTYPGEPLTYIGGPFTYIKNIPGEPFQRENGAKTESDGSTVPASILQQSLMMHLFPYDRVCMHVCVCASQDNVHMHALYMRLCMLVGVFVHTYA